MVMVCATGPRGKPKMEMRTEGDLWVASGRDQCRAGPVSGL
ncbi:hypothetical protein GDO81_017973 [Engystomops pustulosus]|uniref:Uncharacterized protein n=1 Tax=Engystomops pustulosus TaxID=76066 RepID=A0AAV7A3Q4_ENGPU|nr:hypothetical protein GDO81_017973 [Engystomops pustulosus]